MFIFSHLRLVNFKIFSDHGELFLFTFSHLKFVNFKFFSNNSSLFLLISAHQSSKIFSLPDCFLCLCALLLHQLLNDTGQLLISRRSISSGETTARLGNIFKISWKSWMEFISKMYMGTLLKYANKAIGGIGSKKQVGLILK